MKANLAVSVASLCVVSKAWETDSLRTCVETYTITKVKQLQITNLCSKIYMHLWKWGQINVLIFELGYHSSCKTFTSFLNVMYKSSMCFQDILLPLCLNKCFIINSFNKNKTHLQWVVCVFMCNSSLQSLISEVDQKRSKHLYHLWHIYFWPYKQKTLINHAF